MATYLSFIKYTQKGAENIRQSPGRLDAAREVFQRLGVELKAFYLTMGRYDIVTVVEAPDDATAAKALLAVASGGSISTETVRAFPEQEYRQIIAELP